MKYILIGVMFWTMPASAQVKELVLHENGSIELPITDELTASLKRAGEWVVLTGPGVQEQSFEVPLFNEDIDRQAGFLLDINGDGYRDLLVRTDIGYGGVNLFHEVLIFTADAGWMNAGTVSNPEFETGRMGFTTSMRSGPVWTHERWDIGGVGVPFRQAEHTITFGGFELRQVFSPEGEEVERMVVAEGLGLYDQMVALETTIGPDGAAAQSPEPDGMAIALWLEPGTDVTLLDWHEMSGLVLVKTAEGATAWIDPEALDIE